MTSLDVHADATTVITGSEDFTAQICNIQTSRVVGSLTGAHSSIHPVAGVTLLLRNTKCWIGTGLNWRVSHAPRCRRAHGFGGGGRLLEGPASGSHGLHRRPAAGVGQLHARRAQHLSARRGAHACLSLAPLSAFEPLRRQPWRCRGRAARQLLKAELTCELWAAAPRSWLSEFLFWSGAALPAEQGVLLTS